jgi:hypothetical protein
VRRCLDFGIRRKKRLCLVFIPRISHTVSEKFFLVLRERVMFPCACVGPNCLSKALRHHTRVRAEFATLLPAPLVDLTHSYLPEAHYATVYAILSAHPILEPHLLVCDALTCYYVTYDWDWDVPKQTLVLHICVRPSANHDIFEQHVPVCVLARFACGLFSSSAQTNEHSFIWRMPVRKRADMSDQLLTYLLRSEGLPSAMLSGWRGPCGVKGPRGEKGACDGPRGLNTERLARNREIVAATKSQRQERLNAAKKAQQQQRRAAQKRERRTIHATRR